jgi:hypothetical protein
MIEEKFSDENFDSFFIRASSNTSVTAAIVLSFC